LIDPLGDRVMKNVPPLSRFPLKRDQLWHNSPKSNNREVPNLELLRKHLLREGRLEKKELIELIGGATNIMKKEPNVLRIKEPVIIVGDIHGQFYDLIHMFEKVVDNRNLPK